MKKTISIILTLSLCAAPFTAFAAKSLDAELRGREWARESVEYCFDEGILTGDEFGNFDLGGNLTRAQMARIFTDAFGLEQAEETAFADSKETDWYYPYSLSIQDYMPIQFYDFNGGDYVTREEFAATLVAASGGSAANSYSVTTYSFDDAADVEDAYKNWLETAVINLYMLGDGDNINPKDLVTRAEACAFLYRVIFPEADKTPITGEAEVSLEQAQEWASAKGATDAFVDAAEWYWYWGDVFGIRPEVMYAQSAKETAYGNYGGAVLPEMNNFAGIKIKNPEGDRTEDHETFATPEDGVRAHFNHMGAYIGVEPVGEVHDRYYVVKSIAWAGTIKYVEQLGGRWCPDIYYGYQVLQMIENMKGY